MTIRLRFWVVLAVAMFAVHCKRVPTGDTSPTTSTSSGENAQSAPAAISAHTSGSISRHATIRVVFVEPVVDEAQVDDVLERSPLSFEPSITGVARWSSPTVLTFAPEELLPAGQSYEASLDLEAALGTGDDFEFEFAIIEQAFELSAGGLRASDASKPERQELSGTVLTSDRASSADVEKMLSVTHRNDSLDVTWRHDGEGYRHEFTIDGIIRIDGGSELTLLAKGDHIGVARDAEEKVAVPGLDTFAVSHARAVEGDETYIEVSFTDPLEGGQELYGLVNIGGHDDLRYEIRGSVVRVYSGRPWSTSEQVAVTTGIVNTSGNRLSASATLEVAFSELKPAARFVGKGVVVPTTQGLTIPIETANLRAVVVEAMQVPHNNLPQFLQVNDLDGDTELNRVGRKIWRKTIVLDNTPDKRNRWVRQGLDISALVKNHPHGMYRLALSFRPNHVEYACGFDADQPLVDEAQDSLDSWNENEEQEGSFWDFWSGGQGGFPYWEMWENRHNPCHPAYYQEFGDHNIVATRNVLVSDLGLIAKRGADGSMVVISTDIKSARPLSGTRVQVLDYQQTTLAEGVTGSDGTTELNVDRKPFVLVARNGDQAGVLRLDDGSALAVGHFDVGGAQVSRGLKGFFYGERGVWRPGDDIFLTFILLDQADRIPDNHPVRFELRSSRGQLVERATRRTSVGGFYTFKTKTDADAPTGDYTARVTVGGATFERTLKIEAITPNRLKIEFDFGTELLEGPQAELDSTLKARWLHGAKADGLNTEVEVTLRRTKTSFPKFTDFVFDDPTRRYYPNREELFSGTLDEEGEVQVSELVSAGEDAPGMLRAHFTTRVYEPSGASSVDRHSIAFAPYKRFVGISTPKGDRSRGMLLTDIKHPVGVAVVDAKGEPVKSGEVELALYKVRWRWWWDKGEDDSLADYVGSSGFTPLQKSKVKIKNGKAEWKFEIKYPDWGRYLITATDRRGGHRSGKIIYVDWPGWAGRAQKDSPGGASVLTFTSDKRNYEVGEKVSLTIPTAASGRGLLSLESGSRVLRTEWIEPTGKQTVYTFEATPDMAPNIYAHMTFLQPHLNAKNDVPIRTYGVIPLSVNDPKTKLEPLVQTADVFEPSSTGKVTVEEKSGRPMTYTLAVVDEGLLGLTRFRTPDAWSHFYRREALAVRSWDLFDDVAGAYGGKLETLLAIGGDGEAEDEGAQSKANRFEPMVRFMGPFALESGGTNNHDVDIPQYIGAVRVMVVAGHGQAFGRADKEVFVRKPLMVLATLPRVLGPGEEVSLPVSVFALEEKIKDVTVKVEVSGPLKLSKAKSKKVRFKGPGDQVVSFPLQVADRLGIGRVKITASGGGESIEQSIEIDVRHPGKRITEVLASTLDPGQKWSPSLTLPGLPGTNEVRVEISRVPPLNLAKRLDYLVGYPHGCVEQTTSKAFPQVYLSKLVELPDKKKTEVETYVRAGVEKLRRFQNATGGFSYWPGGPTAHDWSTSYAGHFLLEAQRAGFRLPPGLLSQWKKHQREAAARWSGTSKDRADLAQAYRLYTLALAGDAQLAAMNRLRQNKPSGEARWRLAAAYQLAGQPEVAKALVERQSTTVAAYQELGNTFGSALRDRAMILETLVLMGDQTQVPKLTEEIAEELGGGSFHSTQGTAFALVAMARLLTEKPPAGEIDVGYSWAKESGNITSKKPIAQVEFDPGAAQSSNLTLTNRGKGALFARVVLSGLPKVGAETGSQKGLSLRVDYLVDGESTTVRELDQGTDLTARITVSNTGGARHFDEIALTHIVPSGWEIHNDRLDSGGEDSGRRSGEGGGAALYDYRDIRDDRVYTYFDLKPGESKTFEVQLNAAYLGRFYRPPVAVEAMYDEAIHAREPGEWITVVRPGTSG